ncbi:MAG: M20/M25/M40 family metallo-hydrolase [bacterium]
MRAARLRLSFPLLRTFLALLLLVHVPVAGAAEKTSDLARLAAADSVIATFLDLVQIPSPSGREEKIARFILGRLRAIGAEARRDAFGNVVARLRASPGRERVPPLLLAAHMDTVPGDKKNPMRPVRLRILRIAGEEWLASDGTTTLGGDDKAGVAVILDVLARLAGRHPAQPAPLPHGPIEAAFTREEETTVRGARRLETEKLDARHALLLDGEKLYEVVWELAGATVVTVRAHGARGGHSGMDIDRPGNVNAIKVLSGIDVQIPQGVLERSARGVIASINAGLVEGGSAMNAIAPEAKLTYLLRSAEAAAEERALARIRAIVSRAERKHQTLQKDFRIELKIERLLPPWTANLKSPLLGLVRAAGEPLAGRPLRPLSIHAGAEANVYAHKKNARGETLEPLLLGVADLHAIHSTRERMRWRSLIQGRDWVLAIVRRLAEKGGP